MPGYLPVHTVLLFVFNLRSTANEYERQGQYAVADALREEARKLETIVNAQRTAYVRKPTKPY